MSDTRYIDVDVDTGELIRRVPLMVSAGVPDANKIVRTNYDGKLDPTLLPGGGAGASDITYFPAGAGGMASFVVAALIDNKLVRASALNSAHAGNIVGITLESGAVDTLLKTQLAGYIHFESNVFGTYRGPVVLGTDGALSPTLVSGTLFVQHMGIVLSANELLLQDAGVLIMLDSPILPGGGSVPYATTSVAGLVVLSEHSEQTAGEVVQADDPRVTGYRHVQSLAASVWTIAHNMNMFPNITVIDSAGDHVLGEIDYIDRSNVTLTFSAAFSGEALLS